MIVTEIPPDTPPRAERARVYDEMDYLSFTGGPNDARPLAAKHHMPMLEDLRYGVPGLEGWMAPDAFIYGREPDPMTVLDLGCHHGYATIDYLTRWPSCMVVAVDPDPDNARKTRGQTSDPRLTVIQAAVTTINGQVRFKPGLHSMTGAVDGDGDVWVNSVTLSHLCDLLGGIVDFCKMDIEGSEKPILKDASAARWAGRVRSLRIDLHGYDPEEAADDLRKLCYRVVGVPWFESIYATRWPPAF